MIKQFTLIAAIALVCSGCLPERATIPGITTARMANVELRRLTDDEKVVIRRAVLSAVKHPDFAEFRWAKFPKTPVHTEYYCGQVNALVAPGQWVGFRPFVARIETAKDEIRTATLIDLSPDRLDIEGVISKCREYGLDPFAAVEGDRSVATQPDQRR